MVSVCLADFFQPTTAVNGKLHYTACYGFVLLIRLLNLKLNIMAKCRIIERTNVDGRKEYVIQQKHFLFRWWLVDAWINSSCGAACTDSFSTLEEAKKNLCYFDDSKCVERVVS